MKTLKFHDSRRVWFTSDTHFGHRNIIQYCLRPWLSDQERAAVVAGERIKVSDEALRQHDEAIITRLNSCVGPGDVLIHAGDVAWGYAKLHEFSELLDCKDVYVTAGNHDDAHDLGEMFGRNNVAERFMVEIDGQRAVVDHYPGDSWQDSHKGAWQLFGHVHGVSNQRRKQVAAWSLSVDIGVDSHDFYPWSWQQLQRFFQERKPAWDSWREEMYKRDKEKGGMAPIGTP